MTNADKRRAAGNFGRWLFRFACVISIVAGVSAATPRSSAVAAEVQWQPLDLAAAMHKGAAEGKLIYIFVEGDNCPPCDAFKQTHLTDPAFIDFVNTVYVPLRAHMGQPDQLAFLQSLQLMHPAVPRFYVITADGRPISMSAGMVMAPPMEGAEVLHMAMGRDLPVDKQAA
ncbi:MAG: thioredoxin family protein, partial [Planctomycetes bacterium]|nr:thioredoxin family protein [Planctomycetota bacterium]